jgi:hypothetical protein
MSTADQGFGPACRAGFAGRWSTVVRSTVLGEGQHVSGEPREPGWYPDQNDPESNRYWNGRAWTARRQPVGAPTSPPAEKDTSTARRPSVDASPPKRRIPIWLWIVGGLMVARSIAGVVAAFDDPGAGSSTAVTSNTPSVSATAVPH